VVPGSPSIPVTQHVLGQTVIECNGGAALAETHVTAYHRLAADDGDRDTVTGGRYLDRLQRHDGAGLIAVRTNVIEWSGMVPTMRLPFAEVPDIHGNGVPSRSNADPSYLRPLVNRRQRSL
jgi:hypothetical protein